MKIKCVNISDPDFYELQSVILNLDTVQNAFTLNNGYPMRLTASGAESQFYNEAKSIFGKDVALALKVLTFNPIRKSRSDQFLEPLRLIQDGRLINTPQMGYPEYLFAGLVRGKQTTEGLVTEILKLSGATNLAGFVVDENGPQLIRAINEALISVIKFKYKSITLNSDFLIDYDPETLAVRINKHVFGILDSYRIKKNQELQQKRKELAQQRGKLLEEQTEDELPKVTKRLLNAKIKGIMERFSMKRKDIPHNPSAAKYLKGEIEKANQELGFDAFSYEVYYNEKREPRIKIDVIDRSAEEIEMDLTMSQAYLDWFMKLSPQDRVSENMLRQQEGLDMISVASTVLRGMPERASYDPEANQAALDWLAATYPEFAVRMQTMSPRIAAGWAKDFRTILINRYRKDLTEVYHEAYHAISLGLLSQEERDSLYQELRDRLGDVEVVVGVGGDVYKVVASKMTNAQAEEYLAYEFRQFMLDGLDYNFPPKAIKQKSFFEKVIDLFRVLFGFSVNNEPMSIEEFFDTVKFGQLPASKITSFDLTDFAGFRPSATVLGKNEIDTLRFVAKINSDFVNEFLFADNQKVPDLLLNFIEDNKPNLAEAYDEIISKYPELVGDSTEKQKLVKAHADYLKKTLFIDVDNKFFEETSNEEEGVVKDSNDESERSDTSLQFGNRLESSIVKSSPKIVKLFFSGILAAPDINEFGVLTSKEEIEEVEFEDLFVQFASAIHGSNTEDEFLNTIEDLSKVNPAFVIINNRLKFLRNHPNKVLSSAYTQIVTFANRNFNRFISTDNQGEVIETLLLVQEVNEIRKWKGKFASHLYKNIKFVSNGEVYIDDFATAISSVLSSNAIITPNVFYSLTGVRVIPSGAKISSQQSAHVQNSLRNILDSFLDVIKNNGFVGKMQYARFINLPEIHNLYKSMYALKKDFIDLEYINKDLSISKLLDPTKRLYALNEMTGLTVLTSKFKRFFKNINKDPDRIENFHRMLQMLGYVTEDSTPDKFILQPFNKSNVILNSMIDVVLNYGKQFPAPDNIAINENVYLGQQQQIGSVSLEFDSMGEFEMARQHLKLLLSGHILMTRAGERSRESVIKMHKIYERQFQYTKDILDDYLLGDLNEQRSTPVSSIYENDIFNRILDEVRRIIYLSAVPDSLLPPSLAESKNKSKYTIMDKYLAQYTPILNDFDTQGYATPSKLIYEYNEDKSYKINPKFIVSQEIKEYYLNSIQNGVPKEEALENAVQEFIRPIKSEIYRSIRENAQVDLKNFRDYLINLGLVEQVGNLFRVNLDLSPDYFVSKLGLETADGVTFDDANFKNLIQFLFFKYSISLIDSIGFTMGNLASFAKFTEVARRQETLGSPIKQTPDNIKVLPRFDSRSPENRDNFMFYVFDDITTDQNQTNNIPNFLQILQQNTASKVNPNFSQKFEEIHQKLRNAYAAEEGRGEKGTDAQFRATLDYYRRMSSTQTRWDSEMEDWYWFQTAMILSKGVTYNEKPDVTKIQFRGEEVTFENAIKWLSENGYGLTRKKLADGTYHYQPTKEGKPLELLQMKFRPKPLKPKGSGLKSNTAADGFSSYFMLKTSAAPILYGDLDNDYMVELYFNMMNRGLDGYGFESSFKSSVPVVDKFGAEPTMMNSVNSSGIGIQLEERGKELKEVVFSKQLMANAFGDVFTNPYLSDANKQELANKAKDHISLIRAMEAATAFEEFKKMGIIIDLSNDTYVIFDKKRLADAIVKKSSAALIDDDTRQVLRQLLEQDSYFEYSNASSLLQSLFLSAFRSNIIDVKVPGSMLIQESDVSVGKELLFWHYDENGNLKEPQVIIPLPSMYFNWMVKTFTETDTDTDLEIFNRFKKAYSDPTDPKHKLIPDYMRKSLMNRTPLDARHSVTPVEVVEYSAPWEAYSVKIPSQLVIPYGFDFDYDKLTFYTYKPTFSSAKDGTDILSYEFVDTTKQMDLTIDQLATNPSTLLNKASTILEIARSNSANLSTRTNSLIDQIGALISDYYNQKGRYDKAKKQAGRKVAEYSKKLQKLKEQIKATKETIDKIKKDEDGKAINDLDNYITMLKDLRITTEAIYMGEDVPDAANNFLTAKFFPRKYAEVLAELNSIFLEDFVPLLKQLVNSPELNLPKELFYNKRAITNSLLSTVRESYMNEELLYLTLSPTTTSTIKETATEMLDDRSNPDMPRWNSFVDPITNLRNSSTMLSGGKAIGIFASGVWVYSLLQQPDVNIGMDSPIGLLFEGFDIKKPIRFGKQVLDVNGNMTSDGLAEFMAAALDLTKTLSPFYAGFNEITAPIMFMLAISSNEGTFNMDPKIIQKFFGTAPVKYLFKQYKIAKDQSQSFGLYQPLREAAALAYDDIRREMYDVVDRLSVEKSSIKDQLKIIINDVFNNKKSDVFGIDVIDIFNKNKANELKKDIADKYNDFVSDRKYGRDDQTVYRKKRNQMLENLSPDQVKVSNAVIDYMTTPIETLITDLLSTPRNPEQVRNLIENYFNNAERLITAAKIMFVQSREFGGLTRNYRDSSAKFYGYESLLNLINNKANIEAGKTILTGINSYNRNTFVNVYRNAIDIAYRLLDSKSIFSQLFYDKSGSGIQIINQNLPFGTTIQYSELESFFKAYSVLNAKSNVVTADNERLANFQYVEELLSIRPTHIEENLAGMYKKLKEVIAEDPQLLDRFGFGNPLWSYLFINDSGFYDNTTKHINENMVTVSIPPDRLSPIKMQTIKDTLTAMRNDPKIGELTQKLLDALALVNFAINPNRTNNGITRITELESFNILSSSLDSIVKSDISLFNNLEFKNQFVTNYINSLILNNSNDARIVKQWKNPYYYTLDSYEYELGRAVLDEYWEGFSSGIPKRLDAIDLMVSDEHVNFPKYVAVKLPYLDSEVETVSSRVKYQSVVYQLNEDETNGYYYDYLGASGYAKQLFLPVNNSAISHKLTPHLDPDNFSKNVKLVGTRIRKIEEDINVRVTRKQAEKYHKVHLELQDYRMFAEMFQNNRKGQLILPMSESLETLMVSAQEKMVNNVVFTTGQNYTRNSLVYLTAIVPLNSLEDAAQYFNIADSEDMEQYSNYLTEDQIEALENNIPLVLLNFKYTSTKWNGNALTSLDVNDPIKSADPEIQRKIFEFFDSIGYTREKVEQIATDSGIGARAMVDVVGHTLTYISEDKLDIADMPEEAAHVYIEMLGRDHPLIQRMLSEISQYDVYDEVMNNRQYYPSNYTQELLELEAIAKLLGREFVNFMSGEEIYPTTPKSKNFFARVWDFIKRLFSEVDTKDKLFQGFYETVSKPMEKPVISKRQINAVTKINDARKSDYLINLSEDSIAKNNISELRGTTADQVLANFDSMFPDMNYLEDWEKEAMTEMIKRGELQISCKI